MSIQVFLKNIKASVLICLNAILLIFLSISVYGQIVINEYSASNLYDFTDNYSRYEDWIELCNTGNEGVNLKDYYLSDRLSDSMKWKIPSDVFILPGEFLLIWATGRDEASGGYLHTNFKLSQTKTDPEYIVLSDPDGNIIDYLQLLKTQLGHSHGRTTDGESSWSIFIDPSPGFTNNNADSYLRYAEKPIMNYEAGFYHINLTISINSDEPDAEIFYTLNGTEPTSSSSVYIVPLEISSSTIVKARVISNNEDILPGFIDFNTYFINENHDLAVFSISADNIEYLLNGNASLVPVGTLEFFNINEDRTNIGYGEFNKHGQDSWVNDQRSIDYISRDECGYNYAIQDKLFSLSERDEFQRIILRAAGDDNYPGIDTSAHMRDMFIQKTANAIDLNLDVRKGERCIMYVNGQYWGIYSIREKVDDHDYTKFYYDQDKYDLEFIMLWGYTWAEYGGQLALDNWYDLYDFIVYNDMSIQANYEFVKTKYDITSLVDYVIINSYVVCSDWLNWNVGWWRGKNRNGEHQKWGYILWDEDATFGHYINYTGIPAQTPYVPPCYPEDLDDPWSDPEGHITVLNALRNNDEFSQYYISRYIDLLNTGLSCESMLNSLDSLSALIEPEITAHITRWGGSFMEWKNNVTKLRTFIEERCNYVWGGLSDCYELTGPFNLSLDINQTGAGKILINSIIHEKYPWQGQYFGGIDIKLQAIEANINFEFDYWEIENHEIYPNDTSNDIVISINESESITAHFKPKIVQDTLVINEINYNSADNHDPGDWVEFYNTNDYAVNLENWQFKDEDDSHIFTFNIGISIEPKGYLVLCNDTAGFHSLFPDVNNYIGDMNFGLSGKGELIRLYNEGGLLIDTVHYNDKAPWPEYPDGNGATLELINPFYDNALPESWESSIDFGTPGAINSTYVKVIESHYQDQFITINVYPNPFNDKAQVHLNTKQNISDAQMHIFNILGEKVRIIEHINSHTFSISRGQMENGLYIFKIYGYQHILMGSGKFLIKTY